MLLFSALAPGHGAENVFLSVVVAPFYYATPANKWQTLFHDYIPSWLTPHGKQVTCWFYEGVPPGHAVSYGPWLVTLLTWSAVILCAYAMTMFLSVILRRQWAAVPSRQQPP